jgi:predicted transposase YbfD/YdcC
LALKGNQGTLHDDVRRFLDDPCATKSTAAPVVTGDHGRIETRIATVSTAINWLQETHQWPGLKAIGKIERTRAQGNKTTTETVYYLLSGEIEAERLNEIAQAHWGIENSLHWVLDVTMNEDQARNRLDNGPNNLAVLRHMALNILNVHKSKISNRRKIKRAGWSNAFLADRLPHS